LSIELWNCSTISERSGKPFTVCSDPSIPPPPLAPSPSLFDRWASPDDDDDEDDEAEETTTADDDINAATMAVMLYKSCD